MHALRLCTLAGSFFVTYSRNAGVAFESIFTEIGRFCKEGIDACGAILKISLRSLRNNAAMAAPRAGA